MAVRPGRGPQSALLAKTDLTTELVKEFTELQGIVGGLYARVQELDRGYAGRQRARPSRSRFTITTSRNPWKTRFRGPSKAPCFRSPTRPTASPACSRLGLQPTGSKDPFALRRQANGIVKTIAEHKLPIRLEPIVHRCARSLSRLRRGEEICRQCRLRRIAAAFLPRAAGVLSARRPGL